MKSTHNTALTEEQFVEKFVEVLSNAFLNLYSFSWDFAHNDEVAISFHNITNKADGKNIMERIIFPVFEGFGFECSLFSSCQKEGQTEKYKFSLDFFDIRKLDFENRNLLLNLLVEDIAWYKQQSKPLNNTQSILDLFANNTSSEKSTMNFSKFKLIKNYISQSPNDLSLNILDFIDYRDKLRFGITSKDNNTLCKTSLNQGIYLYTYMTNYDLHYGRKYEFNFSGFYKKQIAVKKNNIRIFNNLITRGHKNFKNIEDRNSFDLYSSFKSAINKITGIKYLYTPYKNGVNSYAILQIHVSLEAMKKSKIITDPQDGVQAILFKQDQPFIKNENQIKSIRGDWGFFSLNPKFDPQLASSTPKETIEKRKGVKSTFAYLV